MKNPVYYWSEKLNFGDEINSWFWRDHFGFKGLQTECLVTGVGSILSDELPESRQTVVLGSGSGLAPRPQAFNQNPSSYTFYAVRGPITCELFDLPPEKACVDPAFALSDFAGVSDGNGAKEIGFVPHISTAKSGDYQGVASKCGLKYIDPRQTSKQVIDQLKSCEKVITEAMHGAIFCDSLRIPWLPVSISPYIGPIKWYDWTRSVELPYTPVHLPVLDNVQLLKLYKDRTHRNCDFAFPNNRPLNVEETIARLKNPSPASSPEMSWSEKFPQVSQLLGNAFVSIGSLVGVRKRDLKRQAISILQKAKTETFLLSETNVWTARKLELNDRIEQFKMDFAEDLYL